MKIRNKLILSALVPLIFMVTSAVVQFQVEKRVDHQQHQGLGIGVLLRGMAIMDVLLMEQSTKSRERAHEQWTEKFEEMNKQMLVLRKEIVSGEEHRLLEQIGKGFKILGSLNAQYDETLLRSRESLDTDTVHYLGRLTNRLRQELQVILPEVERLYERNAAGIVKLDQIRDRFNKVLILFLGVFCPVVAVLLFRAVAVPVTRLQEGIKRISDGDLDFRLAITSDDEIGQLSKLFNEMTERRHEAERTILQMNDDLEKRVMERTAELEQVTKNLRSSEEKYRIVSENTLEWAFWLDLEGLFIYCSPACQYLTGYSADEFHADTGLLSNIVHPDDRKLFQHHRHKVTNDNLSDDCMAFRIIHRDGDIRWIEHSCQPIFADSGELLGNRGSNRDITGRKFIEQELKESRQQLTDIIDFLPDATFVVDIEKKVIAWNRAMEEMTGVNKQEMLGQGDNAYTVPFYGERRSQLLDLLDMDDAELAARYKNVQRRGDALYAEVSAPVLYGGKGAYLWASCAPLYNSAGVRVGAIEVIRDISERKQAEIKLVQLNSDLNERTRVAEAASCAKGEFLANMSHEIRTPMNAITGMAYLALRTDLEPRQRDYVSKILQSAESLLGIINDILDFSKIEAGKLELEAIPFALGDVFEGISALIGGKAEEKGLEILFSLPMELPQMLVGDPLRLGQLLGNLAGNAVKFTAQGHVVIAVEQSGTVENNTIALTFSVSDTGIGMNHDQVEKVFEAFSQADSSITRRYGGTGLGLSIVKRLLELMNGELEVASEPGQGSRFSFTLRMPVAEEQPLKRQMTPADLRGMRVLVVDDNAAAREILTCMLTSFTFRVTTAASGAAALAKLRQASAEDPYSLVFMDWRMPEMDGFEAIRHIRKDEEITQSPAIIMVTAFGREELRSQVGQLANTAYLTKPVQPSLLFNTVMDVFGKTDHPPLRQEKLSARRDNLKRLRGSRVLVVEDNVINQQVAREIIEQAGVMVEVAGNGLLAVEAIKRGVTFDAVLMDIQMPVMDGYEATRLIREQLSAEQLPIIAMTAHAMAGEREKCLAAGMNDHVTKPIDPRKLYATLATWLPRDRKSDVKLPQTTDSADLPDVLPGINLNAALARVMGNRRLLREIIISFRADNLTTLEKLRQALSSDRHDQADELLHTLKGTAGNIGAESLFAATRALEESLRKERTGDVTIQLEAVGLELETVLGAARQLEKTLQAGRPLPLCELTQADCDELAVSFSKLAVLLAGSDFEAVKVFAGIKKKLPELPELALMEEQMRRLEYKKAFASLREVAGKLNIPCEEDQHE